MPWRNRAPAVALALGLAIGLVGGCGGAASPAPSASVPGGARPVATNGSSEPGPLLFSAIYASTLDDVAAEAAGFTTTIGELGGRAAVGAARRDPRIVAALVRDAIAAGARGISVTAPDGSVGPAIARLAAQAGIPLVATQARIVDDTGTPLPFVGIDDAKLGETVGAAAAGLVARSGWKAKEVGILSAEVQTLATCVARAQGQLRALGDAGIPSANVVRVPFSGEVLSARDAALPLITAGPQVRRWVVVGCTDQGVKGVLDALETARFSPADVIGVGLGADLACRAWARGEKTGFRAALFVDGGEVGATAARILWDVAHGGDPPPTETIVRGTMVTPASYEDLVPTSFADACAGPVSP